MNHLILLVSKKLICPKAQILSENTEKQAVSPEML